MAVHYGDYGARRVADGIELAWSTTLELDTAAFAIRSRAASGSEVLLPARVLARGASHPYRYVDARPEAQDGRLSYQIVEVTVDGAFGDATPWFDLDGRVIERTRDRSRAGDRLRRGSPASEPQAIAAVPAGSAGAGSGFCPHPAANNTTARPAATAAPRSFIDPPSSRRCRSLTSNAPLSPAGQAGLNHRGP